LTVPLTSTWPPAGPKALGVALADRTVGDSVAADAAGAPNTSDPNTSDPKTREPSRPGSTAMGEGFLDLGMHDFTVKWFAFRSPAGRSWSRSPRGRR